MRPRRHPARRPRPRAEATPVRAADRDWVCLGVVGAAVGLRGDLRIVSHTADPAAIAAYGPLRIGREGPARRLRVLRRKGRIVIGHLEGIGSREAAEGLRGTLLWVARAALPPPEADSFYHHDLVGLVAEDEVGRAVGRVRAVHNFGAGDILEIERVKGAIDMVPFTRDFVPVVDLEGGRIVVASGRGVP